MVQDGIDIMEDVPLGDGRVAVMGPELFKRPVGDVLAAIAAVFCVGVEREALGSVQRSQCDVGNQSSGNCPVFCSSSDPWETNYFVLSF
jgi:hypothetical protein